MPGDLLTKGADFLAEAERLRQQETAKIGLCSLQGTLCLYERFVLVLLCSSAGMLTGWTGIRFRKMMILAT